ncbi:hypothetical protein BD779DRAFT_643675 [Infundibulicybe gibba]|nr:hypothetical protein BD779DRAFT_1444067 [Infundibulicybe gibba]KAF8885932.1 hypothetical protein BD779DRAFT_643675 [Infundibulicybe gibba]
MVLKVVGAAISAFFPTQYLVHILVALVVVLVFHTLAQGRRTTRERDLHARVILITGGFTPAGLTLVQALAQRGAHIISLSSEPVESPRVAILVDLLRSTTSNEHIFAEHCDMASPHSIRSFCTRFLTGQDQRLDAIILAHEYQHIGPVRFLSQQRDFSAERDAGSLATFLLTTLLLPTMLVAPVERDIRIINVINPFYAAAANKNFSPSFTPPSKTSTFLLEGTRSLRTAIFTRHLQRILDALPSAQVPKTDDGSTTVPVVSPKVQKSNIVAVTVSPGISRVDTVASLLNADWTLPTGWTARGLVIYIVLQPLLRILAKSPFSAIQSILHTLFLPTPFKILSASVDKPKGEASVIEESVTVTPVEALKPGALYADCAVVNLNIPPPPAGDIKTDTKGKGKQEEMMEIPDDGEFGGELMGRLVWEAYEDALKAWEKANPAPPPEEVAKPDTSVPQTNPDPY